MAANLHQIRIFLETGSLDKDTWEVVEFEGEENLSQLFNFDITVRTDDPALDFDSVVNQKCTLSFERDGEMYYFHGWAAACWQGNYERNFYSYHVRLVPRLWTLSLFKQSRIFQQMSIPDILKKVLQDAGLSASDFEITLSGFPRREFTVQYQETDLDFIMRLMEHEGIHFYWTHDEGFDKLIIENDSKNNPFVDAADLPYRYNEGLDTDVNIEYIYDFRYGSQMVTGKVILKEFNYRTPETNLKVESMLPFTMPGVMYEYANHYLNVSEGNRLAKIRNEELACQHITTEGQSNTLGFRVGHLFKMKDHFRDELNDTYLLTSIQHSGAQNLRFGGGGTLQKMNYQNKFKCIPSSVSFRPVRRTSVPSVNGIITAKVETSGGEYAFIDDNGEYHIKFPFDLSSAGDGTASLPVPMSQPYSGNNYGHHFPLHANTNVTLGFEAGDLDRPIILGTIPNPSNVSPALSANKHQNVIRTWGQNELTFDDKQGSENIYLFATKDNTIEVTNDRIESVGHDEQVEIGHDQKHAVGNNRKRTVGVNESITVGANQDVTVGVNESMTVGANQSISVGSSRTVTVALMETVAVGAAQSITVGAAQAISVGGVQSVSVGTSQLVTIGGTHNETVGSNSTVTVGANANLQVGQKYGVEVGKDASVTVGKKITLESGDNFTITAGKKAIINASDQLTLKCGSAEIVLKKNGDISIKGGKITIKGSGNVNIKGSQVTNN